MTRKPGLTADQYAQVAAELTEIRNRLVTLTVMISNAYPLASRVGRLAEGSPAPRVCQPIDALREALELANDQYVRRTAAR